MCPCYPAWSRGSERWPAENGRPVERTLGSTDQAPTRRLAWPPAMRKKVYFRCCFRPTPKGRPKRGDSKQEPSRASRRTSGPDYRLCFIEKFFAEQDGQGSATFRHRKAATVGLQSSESAMVFSV